MMDIFLGNGVLTVCGQYKVGDMPPIGYTDLEEWWHVQKKGGLKQIQCGCGKWCFPQQLSGEVSQFRAKDKKGNPVTIETPICLECVSVPKTSTETNDNKEVI
jgi:hypothetical protein